MANQYKNKIVYNGTILLDLSGDTVTLPEHIMAGFVGHLSDGRQVTGTGQGGGTAAISVVDTEDSHGGTIRTVTALDISDTTAVAADVSQGKYFYTAQGIKTPGTASGGGSGQGYTVTTIISEQTVTPSAQQDGTIRADLTVTGIIEGNSDYLITYNNDEYLFTSKLLYNYIDVLGGDLNYLWSSSSDGLYPFLILHDRNEGDTQICVGSATSCTVKVEKIEFSESGGNIPSGQTATGTVTGSGTTILQIPCSFEPDFIHLYADLTGDVSLRGVTAITIIKDVVLYQSQDGSSGNVNESTWYLRGITGYNESDTVNTHASYSNGTLTIDTVSNSAAYRFTEGITYNYQLSTIGTRG